MRRRGRRCRFGTKRSERRKPPQAQPKGAAVGHWRTCAAGRIGEQAPCPACNKCTLPIIIVVVVILIIIIVVVIIISSTSISISISIIVVVKKSTS